MIYFANPSSAAIIAAMEAGDLGCIDTPIRWGSRPNAAWVADNGCFGKQTYPGDDQLLAWLAAAADRNRCRFAVAPDVVGDWAATLERTAPLVGPIRSLGFPVAVVAQDGLTAPAVPWPLLDALFIGGSTAWKLGADARGIVAAARARGVWVHMGRVNTWSRLQYARDIGCDSVDGTFLAFGPDKNLPRLRGWLKQIERQTTFAAAPSDPVVT